jgi:hypothetical protein
MPSVQLNAAEPDAKEHGDPIEVRSIDRRRMPELIVSEDNISNPAQ